MPVDAHSQQGAPSLLATRYGGPITIRAKVGMPKANPKARRTQRSPLYSGQQHQHCMALALTARGQMHIVLADLVFIPPYNRVNFHGKLLVYDHTTGKTPRQNETYNKNKIVHTRESGTCIPKGASACARDLINPTFMTLNVSFRVSKEQDTTSKKCMHRYALEGR